MSNAVISGASYVLVHAPNIMMVAGTTQLLEKENPNSEYIKRIKDHIRSYDDAVAYPPNQACIGNISPEDMRNIKRPWYENPIKGLSRFGRYGEIMPEDEFYGLMAISDVFDLVILEREFAEGIKQKLSRHPLLSENDVNRIKMVADEDAIKKHLENGAVELMYGGKLVGCVRKAHDRDETLSAHVMIENLATKASAVLALRYLLKVTGIASTDVDYIIECSEEACGDMNQRGGGNFAKAIGEIAGCGNATGADMRGFCAGPTHALISAAALVNSGIYKNVVVVAGGATAKLGMNGRDHVNKGMPVLEDVLGGFAVLVSANDGVNPIIRLDSIGKHPIAAGAAPQAVMQNIVYNPLDRLGLKAFDVDKYAPELQNPEITEPAGAGDVPRANYRMIAAIAVKRGELRKEDMDSFVEKHGVTGFAPTQGHIPSGVPIIGYVREQILAGNMKRAMIIGKGSLFLARMTNLFDGISFIMEKNPGIQKEAAKTIDVSSYLAEAFREFAEYLETRGKVDASR
ncbi:glycine/sarcosine/betaine reductase complex component C subunit beta [Thermosediminibacter litoriperuensis]|uniref:Betaine reductase n=1 Tax=Thermosediminibacter litoriperuensis TaxID=291989 RepID=A0A5S5AKS6_9FIRM|nr:glycine/sarcosine/betaine reductase complex component C subunit beta [Thermosediminibacter litoriperuensis]TYP50890.1 betaine reductase [Thermosediminibacter litoriperuensis]